MKRRMRKAAFVAMCAGIGIVFQFGGSCIATSLTIGMSAIDFCSLLGPNCTLGPIAFCGNPLVIEDNLLVDCPIIVE